MDRLSEGAIQILDELHRERLDYYSEYVSLMEAVEKLARYEDDEAEGRLLILPCKVGDTVFCIRKNPYAKGKYVKENKVLSITWDGRDFILFTTKEDVFGKTAFPSREKAERALKGENDGER